MESKKERRKKRHRSGKGKKRGRDGEINRMLHKITASNTKILNGSVGL
jgi:hypothetical protein